MYRWTEMAGDAWIPLGLDTWCRLSEIVAVYSARTDQDYALLPFGNLTDGGTAARAAIVLRDGAILPSYVSAKAVMKRIAEAHRG